MPKAALHLADAPAALEKCPSGIAGLDQITGGGLPRGRTTLVCGSAGTGKSLMAMEFLVRGARDHGEPGVFVSFEERAEDWVANTASMGFDLPDLIGRKQLQIEEVRIERSEIIDTGEYNLDGLFIRLAAAIQAVGAKRIALDTIELLFGALTNLDILRSELHRLFGWLRDMGVTSIVTAERGAGAITRSGLEEYVSDCVLLLDQRVVEQIATRRMHIVKYRGSQHGTNEYPFVIGDRGMFVMPITASRLDYSVSDEFVSTGIVKVDEMLGGRGYYRGSIVMLSGTAGTGKSSIASHFVDAACRRGERCLYFALEEAPKQIVRNMRAIGIDLQPWCDRELLRLVADRPTTYGLDMHISLILQQLDAFRPEIVVVDPVSAFDTAGTAFDARCMLMRIADELKSRGITGLLTSLIHGSELSESVAASVTSLVDTWLQVREIESAGERGRGLYIMKSRGMSHSHQVRELLITDDGVDLQDIHVGPDGVLVGSARLAQETKDSALALENDQMAERARAALEVRRTALKAQVAALEAQFASDAQEIELALAQAQASRQESASGRRSQAEQREQVEALPGDAAGARASEQEQP